MNTVPVVAALITASATTVAALVAIVASILRDRGTRRRGRRDDACVNLLDTLPGYSAALHRLGLDVLLGPSNDEEQLAFVVPAGVDTAVHQGRVQFDIALKRINDAVLTDTGRRWERMCEAHSQGDPTVSASDVDRALGLVVDRALTVLTTR